MRTLSTVIALCAPLPAVITAGPLFPQKIEAMDRSFDKLGEYRYVYRIFFDIYEAALFTEPGAEAVDVMNADAAFHLQFRYLRDIDKSIILKSADRMLEKNLSDAELEAIRDRVAKINEAYTSVGNGDTSSLTYKPDVGTTLTINDEAVVTIPGEDFARLYFRIWLGEQAISESLKENLLGQR